MPRDEVVAFLHPLPVGALWGVGEQTEEVAAAGSGCAPSATSPRHRRETLQRALGDAAGSHLHDAGVGP